MGSRLKWAKEMLREVNQDRSRFWNQFGGFDGAFQFKRLQKFSLHDESSSRFSYSRKKRKQAAPSESDIQSGRTLTEAVACLINRVHGGTAIDSYGYVDILQGCFKQKDFELAEKVHDFIKNSGLEGNRYVFNSLLKCYIGCGRLQTAQELFNNFKDKDIVSWNTMIGGYAENDKPEDVIETYKQLRAGGGQPDAITYITLLKICATPTALELGKALHTQILHEGLQTDIRVGTALVNMYAKCGSIENARAVFNGMERRNVVCWNAMIGGLAQLGHGREAFALFHQMQREGFTPNCVTYLCILSARADPGDLAWVKEVHNHAATSGLAQQLSVSNALIHMYAECGSIDDARLVFDSLMNRDVISWNAMIGGLAQHGLGHEAFSLFLQMQREGCTPNAITYVNILNPCSSSTGALQWVKEVHSHAVKAGLDVNQRVGNALVHMYAKVGSIGAAKQVFDKMLDRDLVGWNVMIGGLAQHGLGHEAFSLFLRMQREGFTPDVITYVNILNACSSSDALEWVKEVHAHATSSGLHVNLRVGNALVHMYANIDSIDDARDVFDKMLDRDVVGWNVMIGGLAQHGLGHEAFSLFLQMQREGFTPDSITCVNILNPFSSTGASEWVKEVHAYAVKAGLDTDLRLRNALVQMYAKIGCLADAREMFDNTLDRDVVSWTVMIGGLAQHGNGRVALQFFEEMKVKGIKPSGTLFVAVLSACSHAGLVDEGRSHFVSMMRDYDIEPTLETCTCLVDTLGRAGHLEEAKMFVLDMPIKPSSVTWKALLGACKIYNNAKLGELAAKECIKLAPMDHSSYVLISNIYAAVGNWDQASSTRRMMRERGIRKNPGLCWIEVDNKVHRFLSGDTSHPESKVIHSMLSSLFERLKAEGYIPDTRLVLWNIDEADKESSLSFHSEKLAIAYGLMHITPGKPIRIYKNLRICSDCHTVSKLISKITGREIVARDANRFHHFNEGLCSCGDFW